MKKSETLRHQKIEGLIILHTENNSDAAILLWEQLSIKVISIVGEGGFDSLYSRSLFLSIAHYSWLDSATLSTPPPHRFILLKKCFESQTNAQTRVATIQLLITFTDILASLIGEQLTTNILESAWGSEAFFIRPAEGVNK
jgi:hypothetical protein